MKKLILGVVALFLFSFVNHSYVFSAKDQVPKVDFSQYKTYAWLPDSARPEPLPMGLDLFDSMFKQAIDTELQKKGFMPAAPGQAPDLLVIYYGTITSRKEKLPGYDMKSGYWQTGRGGSMQYVQSPFAGSSMEMTYREGSITVDIADDKTDTLLWRGYTSKQLADEFPTPQKAQKRINESIQKMFKKFPPK